MLLVAGIFSIFLIRIIGALDSMQSDLRLIANRDKKLYEPESEEDLPDTDENDEWK